MSNTTENKKVFDPKSAGFAVSLLTLFFGVLTVLGIDIPDNPNTLAGDLVATVSTMGWFGLVGVFGSALFGIGMQIYTKAVAKQLSLQSLFANVNTWLYIVTALGSIAAIYGLQLPAKSLTDLVMALYNADYIGALSAIVGLVQPIIRFFKQKRIDGAIA